ncbi:MAG: hypothetical protein WDZ35_12905 [Crocinitomicaceae bacterium]
MHLQHLIKCGLFFLFIFALTPAQAQRDTVRYIKSPYRAEYTPHFKLGQFKRGFFNDSLKTTLNILEGKHKNLWSRQDSLQFAQTSLKTGNEALSEYYYDHLNVSLKTEEAYWYDQLIIFYLNKEYKQAIRFINKESPMVLEFSRIYFFKKIFKAKIQQEADDKWHKKNEIFDWKVDSSLLKLDRDDPQFQKSVTQPLRNLEFVLQKLVAFVHKDDPILANSFKEMGYLIETYFNLTHAYIAYSIGRHYNKRDKRILNRLNDIKSQLAEKKHKIPNFRRYFPRTEHWRFEYKVLKEKVISAREDTTEYIKPTTMREKEEPVFPFPYQLVTIGGILILFLLVLLLLRSKKK